MIKARRSVGAAAVALVRTAGPVLGGPAAPAHASAGDREHGANGFTDTPDILQGRAVAEGPRDT
ncbi:hypothetical protein ABZW30_10815 [Kitasatospora sp. NPDC004669]|uniref:hypothetical protein n=1 Tax=Kitasatospora sp. NPDC004669 TaxID=3154555 RepID=UPI0033A3E5D2